MHFCFEKRLAVPLSREKFRANSLMRSEIIILVWCQAYKTRKGNANINYQFLNEGFSCEKINKIYSRKSNFAERIENKTSIINRLIMNSGNLSQLLNDKNLWCEMFQYWSKSFTLQLMLLPSSGDVVIKKIICDFALS